MLDVPRLIFMQEDLMWYGIDWNGSIPSGEEVESVTVPRVPNPLPPNLQCVLYEEIDSTASTQDPVELYLATCLFVNSHAA